MNAREIVGKEIIGEEGSRIGIVKDIVVDTTSWQVKPFEVQLAKSVAHEFGMKRIIGSTLVPLNVDVVKGIGDTVILKIPKRQIQAMIDAIHSDDAGLEKRSTA
jgi:sporulation protein YlmC with PRC-barrel domain